MERYEGAREKLNEMEIKKQDVDFDEFDEFMKKVEEVNKMVHALTSGDKKQIEEATKAADKWIEKDSKKSKRWWNFLYIFIFLIFFGLLFIRP